MSKCEDLNAILLGSIPKHENLRCLLGTINFSEIDGASISNKAYQWQIYKTRCLIFSNQEVIASPVLGAVENIYLIMSQDYYETGKLTLQLEKLNIKVGEPVDLTNSIYETCLRYSILAKLAPAWNQVERYIVRGRDFLLSSAPLDAAKLDIVINERDMHIVLWPLKLRLPQVCAENLHLMSAYPQHLSWDLSPSQDSIHVLPSLNRANVLAVTDHIPQNSLFKTYKDLKRHWKNSYGYRLPESDEGMVYVTVKFGRWFSESLTYPVLCVRAQRPVFLRQRAPDQLLMTLLADLHARVPLVCGHPFGIDATMRYAVPKLSGLSQALLSSNLTEMRHEPMIDLKMGKEEDREDDIAGAVSTFSQPLWPYTQTQNTPFGGPGRSVSPMHLPVVSEGFVRPPVKPTFAPIIPSKPKSNPKPSSPTLPPPVKPTFAPIFTKKPKSKSKPSSLTPQHSVKPTFAPIFNAKPNSKPKPSSPTSQVFYHSPTNLWEPCVVPNQHNPPTPMKPIFGVFKTDNAKKPIPSCSNPKIGQIPFSLGNPEKILTKTLLQLPIQDSSESKKAKSRSRPQVQTDMDVRSLAQTSDGFARVNTTTLISYLRENKVPCKVKDRKADLVAKVRAHLNLP